MPDMLHVSADLVRSSSFEHTFHECDITKAFQHTIVRHRRFANATIHWEDCHLHTIFRIAPDVSFDASFVGLDIAPHQSAIFATRGLVEELRTEVCLRLWRFRHYE